MNFLNILEDIIIFLFAFFVPGFIIISTIKPKDLELILKIVFSFIISIILVNSIFFYLHKFFEIKFTFVNVIIEISIINGIALLAILIAYLTRKFK